MASRPRKDSSLRVELLRPDQRDLAAVAWAEIELALPAVPLACAWDWTEVWLAHYGDSLPYHFAIVRRGQKVCGAALLVHGRARRSRISLHTLHLGTAGGPQQEEVAVERNGLLCAAGDRPDVARALVQCLRRQRGVSELRLDGFLPEHFQALAAAEPSLLATPMPSPTVDLGAARRGDGDVLATLPRKTNYDVRRSLRIYGPVSGEWAETEDQAMDIFGELVELHQARWQGAGQPGAFASRRRLGFARMLIGRLLPSRRVSLFRVRSERQTIGCLYNLHDGGHVLCWQNGLAAIVDNRCKPGYVAHVKCMQASMERGLDAYDLLCGDSPYKRALSNAEDQLIWARGMRRGLRSALAERLQTVRSVAAATADR